MSPTPTNEKTFPAPLVALASWVLPGLGYLLIGQRKRGVVVGATILLLFVLGLLIGGVRVMEVPGYGENGRSIRVLTEQTRRVDDMGRAVYAEHVEERPDPNSIPAPVEYREIVRDVWVMRDQPMSELRNKPWSIAQVLNGPAALLGMAWSAQSSRDPDGPNKPGTAAAEPSHSRVNEIGVLYTAVAGMLNLLAIIDAASRAGNLQEQRAAASGAPPAGAEPAAA